MKIFKRYIKNLHYSKVSFVERYITKEAIEFCSNYLLEADSIGIPKYLHDERYGGKYTQVLNVKTMV